ncbi:hypothetical protein SAMN05216532_0998 [Streptomyces sp. 2231.1]|uniref:hypothetical protein n=1 Tax=Streptomyces sp. 2231.1 TaxID=1855347 RepID=UPI0008997263|nr:hypothetical protein [Streptomyces sp. 2231.1]SEC29487.1 hypothetical protein SAMN05216532_0998 [Streptomyces sp. 2231.1]
MNRLERTDRPQRADIPGRRVDRNRRTDGTGEPIYDRLVAEWRAQGRAVPIEPDPPRPSPS